MLLSGSRNWSSAVSAGSRFKSHENKRIVLPLFKILFDPLGPCFLHVVRHYFRALFLLFFSASDVQQMLLNGSQSLNAQHVGCGRVSVCRTGVAFFLSLCTACRRKRRLGGARSWSWDWTGPGRAACYRVSPPARPRRLPRDGAAGPPAASTS